MDLKTMQDGLYCLRRLKPGWLDGEGEVPDAAGLDWLSGVMTEAVDNHGMPAAHIYPTETGGVSAEWTLGVHEISAEFDLSHRVASIHSLNTETGRDAEYHWEEWHGATSLAGVIETCAMC